MPEERKERRKVGPFFGIIIIVLILAICGIYFAIKQAQHIRELKIQAEQFDNS